MCVCVGLLRLLFSPDRRVKTHGLQGNKMELRRDVEPGMYVGWELRLSPGHMRLSPGRGGGGVATVSAGCVLSGTLSRGMRCYHVCLCTICMHMEDKSRISIVTS